MVQTLPMSSLMDAFVCHVLPVENVQTGEETINHLNITHSSCERASGVPRVVHACVHAGVRARCTQHSCGEVPSDRIMQFTARSRAAGSLQSTLLNYTCRLFPSPTPSPVRRRRFCIPTNTPAAAAAAAVRCTLALAVKVKRNCRLNVVSTRLNFNWYWREKERKAGREEKTRGTTSCVCREGRGQCVSTPFKGQLQAAHKRGFIFRAGKSGGFACALSLWKTRDKGKEHRN